jgi:hypothetical protein
MIADGREGDCFCVIQSPTCGSAPEQGRFARSLHGVRLENSYAPSRS